MVSAPVPEVKAIRNALNLPESATIPTPTVVITAPRAPNFSTKAAIPLTPDENILKPCIIDSFRKALPKANANSSTIRRASAIRALNDFKYSSFSCTAEPVALA